MDVLVSATTLVPANLGPEDTLPYQEVKLHSTDLFLERRCIHLSFIYRRPQDARGLKASLSKLIKLCPIIAGRVSLRKSADGKPAPVIACDNAGVPFTEQLVDATVDDFGSETFRMESVQPTPDLPIYMAGIDMDKALVGQEALMQVKVTQLNDGGSIFSAAFAHIAVDGRSVAMLCSAWVALYNGADVAEVPSPPVDRSLLSAPDHFKNCEPEFDNKSLKTCYESLLRQMKHVYVEATEGSLLADLKEKLALQRQLRLNKQAFPGSTLTREVMYIPRGDVTKFKAKVFAAIKATRPFSTAPTITANDALSALVWHVTALLRQHPLPGQQEELPHGTLGFAFDVRSPNDGLPSDYVGNAALNFWLPGGQTTFTQEQKLLPSLPSMPQMPSLLVPSLPRFASLISKKASPDAVPIPEPESPPSSWDLIPTNIASESDDSSSSEASGSESGSPTARSVASSRSARSVAPKSPAAGSPTSTSGSLARTFSAITGSLRRALRTATSTSGSEAGSSLARSSSDDSLAGSNSSDSLARTNSGSSEGSLARTNSGSSEGSLPRTNSGSSSGSLTPTSLGSSEAPLVRTNSGGSNSSANSATSRSTSVTSSASSYESDEDFDALAATSARLRTTIATLRDPKAVWQMTQVQAEMADQSEKQRTRRRAVCVADVECYTGTWTGFSTAAFDFGTGAPHAANGFTSPFNPWWFNFVEDPAGGLQISAFVPSSASEQLREHPLWRKCLPNARFLGEATSC